MDHNNFLRPIAPIAVVMLLSFSSFYFLPPSVGAAPGPDAVTSTTNQALAPMTTNQVFNTFGSCFQSQCSQPIKYVFKPSGFAYWSNPALGNITATGFTVGGQTRSVTAFSNSTTIDYHIVVTGIVTMDVYFKEKPTNGLPSNTFKVTMIGTSSVSGTFTWNFGNPNAFPITCDNTKKILTYGVTGLNFTDSVNFSATCTTTSVSFTIGVGAFKIDPSTVATTNSPSATRYEFQNKAFWIPSLSLFAAFYPPSGFATIACRTSTDGSSWSAAKTISINVASGIGQSDFWFSGSTLYYVRVIPSNNTFRWRYGTFSAGCSVTWTNAESSISTTGTNTLVPSITIDPSSNLWVAVETTQSANTHTEVWECAGAISSCTWTKSLDVNFGSAPTNYVNEIVADSTFLSIVFGTSNSGGYSIKYSINSGSTWSSTFTSTSAQNPLGNTFASHSIALGSKVWTSGSASGSVINSFDTSTNTFGTRSQKDASGAHAIIVTDGTNLYLVSATSSEIDIYESFDSGSTFTPKIVLATSQSIAASSMTSTSTTGNSIGIEWTNSGGTSVLFQTFNINVPQIIQSTSCTFTGSSGTCAFASNTKAASSIVVFTGATATTTVTSVTDTQSLTYTLIVASDVGTVGDNEAWWACHPSTAAADTITVTYGVSVTSTIILYELHGRPTGTGCAPSSSTGSSASASSASVTSYTPTANAFIIGALNSNCQVACTITAGSGYSKDKDVAINAVNDFTTEYFWNVATADTTPYTFSLASAYNEISVAFYDLTWKNESFAPSMAFAPAFTPKLTLSKAFGLSATFTSKFNQALNLHSFFLTLTFSPVFNEFSGLTPPPQTATAALMVFGIIIGFMLVALFTLKRRR